MLKIKKMYAFFKLQIKKAFIYRLQFLSSIIISPIILLLFYSIWRAIYSNYNSSQIMGYTFEQMMMYYVITLLIGHFTYNIVGNKIQRSVVYGYFINDLLKPLDPKLQFLSIEISDRVFALFTEVIPIFIISVLLFNIHTSILNAIFFSIGLVIAFFLNYSINFLMGLLSFWIIKIDSVQWLTLFVVRFLSGEYAPLEIISPLFLKISMYFPFYYIRYGVAQIFLDKFTLHQSIEFLIIQASWTFFLFIVGSFIWEKSIKRFGAVGG